MERWATEGIVERKASRSEATFNLQRFAAARYRFALPKLTRFNLVTGQAGTLHNLRARGLVPNS